MTDAYINSFGAYVPGDPISNAEMEDYLGLVGGKPSRYRALVLRQNRIQTRHYALDKNGAHTHTNAEMAIEAINDAIRKSELSKKDITYLAAATTMGDFLVPGFASHIHAGLGLPPIEIANFQSVCASAMMALKSAYLQIKQSEHACAAVCGSEFASRYFRPGFYEQTEHFQTKGETPLHADYLRFTLSDGAGAALLENKPNARQLSLKIHWIDIRSYADRFDASMTAGAVKREGQWQYWSNFENLMDSIQAGALMLTQDFNLMRSMLPVWVAHFLDLIDQGKVDIKKIDHVCCHYSAHSLRDEVFALLKNAGALIPEEKWFTNLYSKGNTGAASIFIMLEELYRTRPLQKGQMLICHVPESGRALNGFMLCEVI